MYALPEVLPNFMNVMRNVTHRFPALNIIYRPSVPGHVDCDKHFTSSRPLTAPQSNDIFLLPDTVRKNAQGYRWFELLPQNDQVIHALRKEFPQVLILNVLASTALRADSHKIANTRGETHNPDCLHYCMPGPVDEWVVFLLGALHKVRTHVSGSYSSRNATNGSWSNELTHAVVPVFTSETATHPLVTRYTQHLESFP